MEAAAKTHLNIYEYIPVKWNIAVSRSRLESGRQILAKYNENI